MPSTQTLVLKVTCGTTLKTTINGQAVEIECEAPEDGGFVFPDPPSGGGGVVAYARERTEGPYLNLSEVAERFAGGHLSAADLPPMAPGRDRAVYRDHEDLRSMDEMVEDD